MKYKKMINELIPIVRSAGKEILSVYKKDFSVDYKDKESPVTRADRLSNKVIVTFLREKYPQIAILSEESNDSIDRLKNRYCFIVDPLDGTKEFIKRNDEFTVNVGLSVNNKSVLGIIYHPVSGEIYYGYRNGGAYYKSSEMNSFKRMYVSNKKRNLTLMMSRSHASEAMREIIQKNNHIIKKVKKAGSSLKGCLVAKGQAEAYFRFNPTMEWDTAAMQIIVEEAGGIFCQLDGTSMYYNRKNSINSKGFMVLNSRHNNLVKRGKNE